MHNETDKNYVCSDIIVISPRAKAEINLLRQVRLVKPMVLYVCVYVLIESELLPLWARKILDYLLDLIRKKSQFNEKGSKYSCNESLTLPDK